MYCMLICRKLFEILSHPYWMTMQPRKQNIIWSKFSPFLKVFFQLEQTTEAFFLRWKSIYVFQATIFCHRLSTVYIDKKSFFSTFFCLPLLSFAYPIFYSFSEFNYILSQNPSLLLFPIFIYILYSISPLSLFFYMPFNSTSLFPFPYLYLSKLYLISLSSLILILFSFFFFCLFFLFFLLFMFLLWRTTYVVG